jgi:sugar O-acyltransferase (sialic acid O-acetyltransferase NeuD family)
VLNQPEVVRPRTKGVMERIGLLPRLPEVIDIEAFAPADDELYALGTTSPGRHTLVHELQNAYGLRLATLVHPTGYVSPMARLGTGVFVGARSVIGPGADIGDHVFINRGVTIGHDTVVEAFARLQPGCNVGGHVRIGHGTMIGMGASVIEERDIGFGAVIAAGSAVIDDVEAETLVAGAPARVKKSLKAEARA